MKKVSIGLLVIPLCFFLLFTVGEVLSGDISGFAHLIQAVPVLLLIFLAWKRPLIGGVLLFTISLILGVLYVLDNPVNFPAIFAVEAFLFIPPFISGILLVVSSGKK